MNLTPLATVLLFIGLFIGTASPVLAHDPGLSKASLQVEADELQLRATFAERDIESVVRLDLDGDGSVSAQEFAALEEDLRSIAAGAMELRSDDILIAAKEATVRLATSGSIDIELHFEPPVGSALRSTFPIINRLPRGHRQYLSVLDAGGQLLGQYVLDAKSSPLNLNVPRTSQIALFGQYLREGVWHIWIGFDHILFLLTLLLPAVLLYRHKQWYPVEELRPALADLLKIVTAFTIAHSITLALAVLELVQLPSRFVETIIAFSVLVTAINNLRPLFPASRWLLGFVFGLVHGFGFATVLIQLELPDSALALSLFGFNVGVEIGQLAIVALLFPVAFFTRHTRLYRAWIFRGGSIAAAVTASIWMFERTV